MISALTRNLQEHRQGVKPPHLHTSFPDLGFSAVIGLWMDFMSSHHQHMPSGFGLYCIFNSVCASLFPPSVWHIVFIWFIWKLQLAYLPVVDPGNFHSSRATHGRLPVTDIFFVCPEEFYYCSSSFFSQTFDNVSFHLTNTLLMCILSQLYFSLTPNEPLC